MFTEFLQSNAGRFAALIFAGIAFIVICGNMLKKSGLTTRALTYAGLALAIAFVLSYIRLRIVPMGGSITPLSMFFVSIIGFWFGSAIGLVSAISYGFLQIAQGATVVHPIQLLLDYPIAFGMLGLSGFFWKFKGGLYTGFIVAVTGRWIISTISGYVFFSQYMPEEWNNAWLYSMAYNASYIYIEIGITLVIIAFPQVRNALEHVKSRLHT
ncbi:MAG: energy-coupled thiamine transporter ThiT [Defluviitaleaceae bacterium]|nr:energy-coupled thiamine transporter ThiT [Defluviitaleaceae bacterium]